MDLQEGVIFTGLVVLEFVLTPYYFFEDTFHRASKDYKKNFMPKNY
jgi:hypothetical protein